MKDIFGFEKAEKRKDPLNFKAVRISIASPKRIRELSNGEVKRPETINYRTFKPEKDGLFCAKIFGPIKDYECLCGKYKRMKHRGIVCEKCGVEVIKSNVRRERLGHISLATPVAHIWFLKNLPSRIGNLIDMTIKDLEKVLYCEYYVVIDPGETPLKVGELLSEEQYEQKIEEYGRDQETLEPLFKAGMGAEAIRELLLKIDLDKLAVELRKEMKETTAAAKKKKLARRLKVVEAFRESNNKPEWMMLELIPVLPPDLRPLVPLEGGRFATSDLNDLYRRVINRNNRLQRLQDLIAPEIIVRNEKRMLQEAVDALFDNGRRGKVVNSSNKRPLKSLSDSLKGKQGRFRQNLLGKRVDYSGRSVIVVGPELKLHQCGLPKKMALELFKPFIYHQLESKGIVSTVKSAKKKVESESNEVWDILEEVIKEHPILLNRAPTLHRLGIQAFEPVLIEGKAIQLHPLVCTAFNADFDGDQMAVHVPLSIEAQMEARVLMMSTNNILSPAYGKPIINPTQDIVLGLYYITRERPSVPGEGKIFSSPEEVRIAFDTGQVDLQAKIKVRRANVEFIPGTTEVSPEVKLVETTVGRVLLGELLPPSLPFSLVNRVMNKKALQELLDYSYHLAGNKATVILADRLRTFGFAAATYAGVSICVDDIRIPSNKAELLQMAENEIREEVLGEDEQLSESEKYNKKVDIWTKYSDMIGKAAEQVLSTETITTSDGEQIEIESFNPLYMMLKSGARGSPQQIRQLAAMRGLMSKPNGEIIDTPIKSNFREGLSVLEYFISTHGARKGLADTALKTANAGHLTRRLVDVAQHVFITEYDCGTTEGLEMTSLTEDGQEIEPLKGRIVGRVAFDDIYHPETDEIIVHANEEIDEDKAEKIVNAGITSVKIRSVLTCESRRGACVLCYGRDLARGGLVNIGETIGVIAAQSIGEPGTQLTMRTFHHGGTAERAVEQATIEAKSSGIVKYHNLRLAEKYNEKDQRKEWIALIPNGEIHIVDKNGRVLEKHVIPRGAVIVVADGSEISKGDKIAERDPYNHLLLAEKEGVVHFKNIISGVTMQETTDETSGKSSKEIIESSNRKIQPTIEIKVNNTVVQSLSLPTGAFLQVENDQKVQAGDILAKIPKTTSKTRDITGGLPRVVELFEARSPKKPAIIAEIDGRVKFGKESKDKRKIEIIPEGAGEPRTYTIPKGEHVIVYPDQEVRAGDPLIEGDVNPHDILRVSGIKELARYLVNKIQEIYRTQGIRINDKHLEVIVKQMLRQVRITDVGDTPFVVDETVEKYILEETNKKVIQQGGEPAKWEPVLLGITKAALSTESFISAASFQETTKVLTAAAIAGKTDYLRGLKENVIMGRLIPAGTGFRAFSKAKVKVDPSAIDEKAAVEEERDELISTIFHGG